MSHSNENVKEGILWDLITYILLQNVKKLEGDAFETLTNFRKKNRTVPKKSKGRTLQPRTVLRVTLKK